MYEDDNSVCFYIMAGIFGFLFVSVIILVGTHLIFMVLNMTKPLWICILMVLVIATLTIGWWRKLYALYYGDNRL